MVSEQSGFSGNRIQSGRSFFYITWWMKPSDATCPTELVLLPWSSAFDPFAYSHGRASGIWQFIPGTGKRLV